MSPSQRITYIFAAEAAFEVCQADNTSENGPTVNEWRHAEVAYALGGAGKSFRDFSQLDLTKCFCHFANLKIGIRLTPVQIEQRAVAAQVKPLVELMAKIKPDTRRHVLRDRFKVTFIEELALLSDREFQNARTTLARLAREYPIQQEARCTN